MISLEQVSKSFDGVQAIQDVSLHVKQGEFVTLIGPSGSGKSTIFNLIAGLTQPDSGHIVVEGKPAYMPQRDLLMPWRSILDNVIVPLEIAGVPRHEARQQAKNLLPTFGLEGFADAYPSELSGGMRQRAALLRTILTRSDILLLDEPFGALDALTRRKLQGWLLDLWRDMKKTVLFVTHDVEEAIYLGDRVLVLSERPGHVQQQVDVQLTRPRKRHMMQSNAFGEHIVSLLEALGVTT
jgi:ABC-type nitrate/sulfonate/bicarbonate transport system ATPase subunit